VHQLDKWRVVVNNLHENARNDDNALRLSRRLLSDAGGTYQPARWRSSCPGGGGGGGGVAPGEMDADTWSRQCVSLIPTSYGGDSHPDCVALKLSMLNCTCGMSPPPPSLNSYRQGVAAEYPCGSACRAWSTRDHVEDLGKLQYPLPPPRLDVPCSCYHGYRTITPTGAAPKRQLSQDFASLSHSTPDLFMISLTNDIDISPHQDSDHLNGLERTLNQGDSTTGRQSRGLCHQCDSETSDGYCPGSMCRSQCQQVAIIPTLSGIRRASTDVSGGNASVDEASKVMPSERCGAGIFNPPRFSITGSMPQRFPSSAFCQDSEGSSASPGQM